MDAYVVDMLTSLLEMSPGFAILAAVAYRLEVRIGQCITHQEKVIETLLSREKSGN